METQLCNGAVYTNPYLSKKNAEFLIAQNFDCMAITQKWIRFSKGKLILDIKDNFLRVSMKLPLNNIGVTHRVNNIDLPLKEFVLLMLEVNAIKADVIGAANILFVTNFNLDCKPFQN